MYRVWTFFRFSNKISRLPFFLFYQGFVNLSIWIQWLFFLIDPKLERQRGLNFFRNCKRLRAMRWEGAQDYPVYVINRTKDSDRMSRFAASCRKWGISYERVEAINCADPEFNFAPYEAEIAETFYGKTHFLRGAVGCFFSHVKVWRQIIKENVSGALICEDDANFLGPIPRIFYEYKLPPYADLVFVNQRTAGGIQKFFKNYNKKNKSLEYFPINNAILYLLTACSGISAIGTDGYVITRQGAEKLLEIFHKVRVSMEVDWFLFFHSLSHEERKQFIVTDGTGRFNMLEFASEKINSYAMLPSFVEQSSIVSIIGFNKAENYIQRDAMFNLKKL